MTDDKPIAEVVPKCEPPKHLRRVDGWHWVERDAPAAARVAALWSARFEWWGFRNATAYADVAARDGWRYIAPAAPPDMVRALVEALETALSGWRYVRKFHGDQIEGVGWDRVEDAARDALARAKEAGV